MTIVLLLLDGRIIVCGPWYYCVYWPGRTGSPTLLLTQWRVNGGLIDPGLTLLLLLLCDGRTAMAQLTQPYWPGPVGNPDIVDIVVIVIGSDDWWLLMTVTEEDIVVVGDWWWQTLIVVGGVIVEPRRTIGVDGWVTEDVVVEPGYWWLLLLLLIVIDVEPNPIGGGNC